MLRAISRSLHPSAWPVVALSPASTSRLVSFSFPFVPTTVPPRERRGGRGGRGRKKER